MKKSLFIILILCLNLLSCTKVFKDTISGYVHDAITGEAIIDAQVNLFEDSHGGRYEMMSGMTDNKGHFKIRDHLSRNQNYVLFVSMSPVYPEQYGVGFNETDDLNSFEIKIHK